MGVARDYKRKGQEVERLRRRCRPVGPMRGAQDVHLGSGSIEVKSTALKGAFIAKINGIKRLDGKRDPQFLRALRCAVEDGSSDAR